VYKPEPENRDNHCFGRNRFSFILFGRLEMPKAPSWKAPAAQVAMPRAQAPAPTPSPRFEACLPDTLSQECPHPNDWSDPANFSNDPHDPGGATMCGITQSEYDTYRESLDEPERSVKLISQAEGQAIYQMSYWQPHCPQLPTGLDLSFFDSSVKSFNLLSILMRMEFGGPRPLAPLQVSRPLRLS